ncbi:MAG: nucleoside 2-deoxyribosyltransferase [Anaerolineae bacterium]|jgi:nucleoside 2-deoxyribosyltransferase
MKVYFAGSIRGGRQDAGLYRKIIELLRTYGEVLTEHVGDADPDVGDEVIADQAIYSRDMAWLEQADAVVAEVTVPSHGVGYEIARAEALGKPILCLFRPGSGRRPSALIAGNSGLRCVNYQTMKEIDTELASFLRCLQASTREVSQDQRPYVC